MKYVFLFFIVSVSLFADLIKTHLLSVDKSNQTATIKVLNIDPGVTGFIVQRLSPRNSAILKSVEVLAYDRETQIATLKMSDFDQLEQNALPTGNWEVKKGDIAILAFGYTRAFLIAPSEEIYYKITKAAKQVHWVHPDIFATILSFKGHPTPLKEDFKNMSNETSAGLVYFYINKKLITVDAKSLKVLHIIDADLEQKTVQLPFYSRVAEIDANWWGEGSGELESYEPYYCSLLLENNPNNQQLHDICSIDFSQTAKKESAWSINNIYNTLKIW